MLAGLECFKQGYIWRVGDGSKINIWEDKWIPNSPNLKVQTMRGRTIITRVNELIDPLTGQWDVDLVSSIFSSVDVHRIHTWKRGSSGVALQQEWVVHSKIGISLPMDTKI